MKKIHKPLTNRVLIKIIPIEERKIGSIILADDIPKDRKEGRQCVGVVVAMGPLAGDGYGEFCKVGDTVQFIESGSRKILEPDTDDERLLRFVNDQDIYANILEIDDEAVC